MDFTLLSKIGRYASDNGGEIPAFDPKSNRLFVVAGSVVEVLSLADPRHPTKLYDLPLRTTSDPDGDLPGGFELVPNSVAVGKVGTVSEGIVAVAIALTNQTTLDEKPGEVQFFDSTTGAFLGKITVGFLPDMLTFTPDGTHVLTANEGQPNDDYTQDPVGSVSIIDLRQGVRCARVKEASFEPFNDQIDVLRASGVRIFGPGATVAQDVEPEYITFSADGQKAWVTLQENNAVAVLDLATATVESILPLGFKNHNGVTVTRLEQFEFSDLPSIGRTDAGQELFLGGFSGLFYEGQTAAGNLKFVTHTDRGPNGEAAGSNRPFLLPNFSPEIVRFELNPSTGAITITERIALQQADGTPLTGLPNTSIAGGNANTPYNDEVPVDLRGNPITPPDPLGADLEGIVVDPADGSFWMVDEYRPAIYHFDREGQLLKRFVPQGTAAAAGQAPETFGTEALPAVLAQRRQNRGFEAVALNPDAGKLYAFIQSPIRNPETLTNSTLNGLNNIRIVEFDLATEAVTAQYLYHLDNPRLADVNNTRADKIGDAVYIGNGEFLLVERDDDAIDSDPIETIEKKIYRFRLSGATNIANLSGPIDLGGGLLKTVDQMTPAELTSQGITLVQKTLHIDLAQAGYNSVEKVEGLALVDANTIAVINDNDFQVAGITIDTSTGTFTPDPDPEPVVLGLISTRSNALDASDRDVNGSSAGGGRINIQNWPVLGMYQPDAIAAYSINGQTYYITANEGDARDYAGFSEETNIANLVLDPTAFPDAATLQRNQNLGRLLVTKTLGDTDGDGDFDQLYAFGARSFSIWDSAGKLIYDSGSDFEQITAVALPANFNSNNDRNNFDNRSDNKGPEPEGLAIGSINDRTYAFVGLERIGGVMVYDVTVPTAPKFVQYINTRDFSLDPESNQTDSGPEGLTFIPAADSPNGKPLLAVSNEISKTTTIFEVNPPPVSVPQKFTLQLLHFSDQEAGIPALQDAPRLSAVLKALKEQDGSDADSNPDFGNTLILSSGDAYIPGAFLNASTQAYGGQGRADILIQNELGVQAIAFGNHEFDLGTSLIANLLKPAAAGQGFPNYPGAAFPYLSGNLDFSHDSNLAPLVTADGQAASSIPGKIAASSIITVNGEKIGVVGATIPTLRTISSPGNVQVSPSPFGGVPTAAELDALAAVIQADVDALLAANPDLNKVILLAHMQQIAVEKELAMRLRNVDVIVAGGSNTRLFDSDDVPRLGDTKQGDYPFFTGDREGKPIAVVNTDGNYKYVGRLVLDFDTNGNIIPTSYDPDISGAYATDDAGVAALNAQGLVDPEIQAIVNQLSTFIAAQDGAIFGKTTVFLNGTRSDVRTQETNLGNLTADANLAIAQTVDPSVVISIKNGGGIRDNIGNITFPPGSTDPEDALKLPPAANPLAGKQDGEISQLDITNSLRFNNSLTLITVTAAQLLQVIEHGVAATAGGATPGQFPQVSGLQFSFDPSRAAGDRVVSLAIADANGRDLDVVVRNGELVGDANRSFRLVTLGFLADGGDSYPFSSFLVANPSLANRVDLLGEPDTDSDGVLDAAEDLNRNGIRDGAIAEPFAGVADFAAFGSEQDALAEHLAATFPASNPFSQADTDPPLDQRIQNLAAREDTVIDANPPLLGTSGPDTLTSAPGATTLTGAGGQDRFVIRLGDGPSTITDFAGIGRGTAPSGATVAEVDTLQFEGAGLTANNLLLTQIGKQVEIRFEVVNSPQVILQNVQLDRLDNLRRQTGATVDRGNILFDGQTAIQDSFDVFNADSQQRTVWNRNTVTFLNELANQVQGFHQSNDVINGQGGNDSLWGLSGDDTLRGGEGSDDLKGGDGADLLIGSVAASGKTPQLPEVDTLTGGAGVDTFALGNAATVYYANSADSDYALITDFAAGDVIRLKGEASNYSLVPNLTLNGVTGTGLFLTATTGPSGELIGLLQGASGLSLASSAFSFI
jgi:2',3'-cyclic-nucleotide 2'-phosphodiesterase (5'-nucleotidase family)